MTKNKKSPVLLGKKVIGHALYVGDGSGSGKLFLHDQYDLKDTAKLTGAAVRFKGYGTEVLIVEVKEGDAVPRVAR